MLQIFLGSLLLSIIHSSIPNHWLPLIAISKSENWSRKETMTATAIAGFSHTASTILIGMLVGLLGFKLSENFEPVIRIIAPAVLIALGSIYIFMGKKHSHSHFQASERMTDKSSRMAIIASLSFGMFFSPCIEIEAYYFSAGLIGWSGILIISAVYLIVTMIGMLILVDLGLKGINKLNWHFLEHNERQVTGTVLILMGFLAFFAY